MKKPKTNVQQLTKMMNFSQYGALKQGFIMTAIEDYAKSISETAPEGWRPDAMISFDAWKGCADECLKELNEHYGRQG